MTPRRILPALALLLLAPPAGAHGPYAGTLRQGEADAYLVDHSGPLCMQVITQWTVTLTYAPTSDVLSLAVAPYGTDVGTDGHASVTFTTRNSCALFGAVVHGTLVRDAANYTLAITTSGGTCGPVGCLGKV